MGYRMAATAMANGLEDWEGAATISSISFTHFIVGKNLGSSDHIPLHTE